MINFEELKKPFPPESVEWRVGSTNSDKSKGMALAYIDARSVQDRLDKVCGVDGWQCRYPHVGEKTVCEIGLNINGEWIWKADGAGDTDVEKEKGALSDAFKRAAVKWGVGRYLYDLETVWVALENKKITKAEMQRLDGIIGKTTTMVTGLNGLSKEPAKWWSNDKLTLSLPTSRLGDTPDNQLDWFFKSLMNGVEKAPNVKLLEKLKDDNKHIIDRFDDLMKEKITEAFLIREEQHKEHKK